MIRAFTACLLVGVTVGCASAPVQPAVAFETKMSWILRLEDRREIRDVSVPVAPPEAAGGRARGLQVASPSPDLFALLADPEARVRRRAALAAGRVGLPEAAPHLVTLLQRDVDPEVRQMAAFALGLLGDQSQVEPLRQALEDPSPVVAGRAAEALGLLGDSASAPAIGRLVAAHVDAASTVGHDDGRAPNASADAFRLGVYALTRLKAYEPLAAATLAADGRPKTQWWPLAYALGRIEDQRALPALLSLAASDGTYTRSFASKGLGALKDPSAVPVLLPLVDAANPAGAVEAMRALARIGDPRAEEPIVGIIRNPRVGPMLRAEALLAAADVGIDTTQDFIVDFLADSAPAVRAAALRAVSKGDADTFMAILSGLDPDPHWSVRADLASLLAEREPERALPRLTEMLRDPDVRVIPRVLDALAKLKAPGLTTILLEHLDREDAVVRTYAAGGLGEIRPPEAVEPLVAAFKRGESDASYSARAAALGALAKYGAAAAVPSLRVALSDRDWAVRVRAAELLKELDPSAETIQAIRPAPVGASTRYDLPSLVNPTVSPHVYFETDKGTIEIELDVLNAPLTSENFIALVGKGFFEGLPVHRLVPDFVAQAGDPRGDGEGGPGYTIRDELNEEPYLRGTVGMALDWQDTGGSQFFIAYSPQPHLDARYTVFGRVVAGMDVVDRLAQWDVMRRVRVWDGQTVSGK